jgi:hypothetical protein
MPFDAIDPDYQGPREAGIRRLWPIHRESDNGWFSAKLWLSRNLPFTQRIAELSDWRAPR